MNQTIPASQLVSVTPGVVGAGGTGFVLNGLFLTTSFRVPIGAVLSFSGPQAVAAFFGANTIEAFIAAIYFQGFANSTVKPGAILFAQYPQTAPVPAYLQSGPVSSLTLAQLQAISGVITVTIDGVGFTSSSFNLAAATSFSTAATIIQTALGAIEASITAAIAPAVGITTSASTIASNVMTVAAMTSGLIVPGAVVTGAGVAANTTVVAQLTGTPGAAGTYQVSAAQTVAATVLTCTNAAQGILTVSAVGSGALAIGQNVNGVGLAPSTQIVGELSGTGGTGTYVVAPSQTVSSESMTAGVAAVTYDSVSGSFFITGGTAGAGGSITFATGTAATPLNLTAETGAVLSQGSAIATPAAFMNALINVNQNWFSLATVFTPVTADQVAFAQWVAAQGDSYLYLQDDSSAALTTPNYSTTAWGIIKGLNIDGTLPIYDPNLSTDFKTLTAGAAGFFASLDFTRTNGRTTLAYSQIPGVAASVTNGQIASQLLANGENFYGVYGSANNIFTWWQNGSVSGKWLWADTYAQAVWLKNALQLALLELLGSVGNIPYNNQGNQLIEAACLDPIQAALNFGAIRPGVALSNAQIAEINNAAGLPIDTVLFARGWYLQVLTATAQVRAQRKSPPITLWYTDGQSVQQINLASLAIE